MDNFIDIIREKAERHRERYRSFDVAGFIGWVRRQALEWQQWAASQSISALNRKRRYESWETIKNAGRVRYTMMPPEDGPR